MVIKAAEAIEREIFGDLFLIVLQMGTNAPVAVARHAGRDESRRDVVSIS